jgi:hypothetical protein
MLLHFKIVPKELAITPFPTPLITPPVTNIYFIFTALPYCSAPLTIYYRQQHTMPLNAAGPGIPRVLFNFKRTALEINKSKISIIHLFKF